MSEPSTLRTGSNNTFVVDASVAVKWVVKEKGSYEAADLVGTGRFVAPDILWVECASALRSQVRQNKLTPFEARAAFADLRCVPVALVPANDLLDSAFTLTLELGHPIYDCLYMALSMQCNIPLLTSDRRLVAAAANHPALSNLVTHFPLE